MNAASTDRTIRFATRPCALGWLLVAQSVRGVCAIFMGDDARVLSQHLRSRFPRSTLQEIAEDAKDADLERTLTKIQTHLAQSDEASLKLPLDIRGTPFQQRVWQALCEIAPGTTATYTDIARRIDRPKAVRAVAQACAANLLAVAIPCHRVINRSGGLSGYRWGVARKQALLEREKIYLEQLSG